MLIIFYYIYYVLLCCFLLCSTCISPQLPATDDRDCQASDGFFLIWMSSIPGQIPDWVSPKVQLQYTANSEKGSTRRCWKWWTGWKMLGMLGMLGILKWQILVNNLVRISEVMWGIVGPSKTRSLRNPYESGAEGAGKKSRFLKDLSRYGLRPN